MELESKERLNFLLNAEKYSEKEEEISEYVER